MLCLASKIINVISICTIMKWGETFELFSQHPYQCGLRFRTTSVCGLFVTMYWTILNLSIFVTLCHHASAKTAPDYIKPCPGLTSECLKPNILETIPLFVKGIPSLGINSSDPLYQDKVDLELPGGLQIHFRDGVLTGFRKCIVESVSYVDLEANLSLRCNLTVKGKYTATGRILIVSINGDGDAKIKTPNIRFDTKLKFQDVMRDGVEYRIVKDYKVKYRFGEKVTFAFTNLFNGNPQLSETVLLFLNENWKQVVDEFGKPVVDTIIKATFENVKRFFDQIPKNELIVD